MHLNVKPENKFAKVLMVCVIKLYRSNDLQFFVRYMAGLNDALTAITSNC